MNESTFDQEKLENPVKISFEYESKSGSFKMYNKESKNTEYFKELNFRPLDYRYCISGYCARNESFFYSNIVKDINIDEFSAMTHKGENKLISRGLWKNIKDAVAKDGGCFTTIIYAVVEIENKFILSTIQLKKSSLNAWINFSKSEKSISKYCVTTDSVLKKNGFVEYFVPNFNKTEPSKSSDEVSRIEYKKLKDYFDSSKKEYVDYKENDSAKKSNSPTLGDEDDFIFG